MFNNINMDISWSYIQTLPLWCCRCFLLSHSVVNVGAAKP